MVQRSSSSGPGVAAIGIAIFLSGCVTARVPVSPTHATAEPGPSTTTCRPAANGTDLPTRKGGVVHVRTVGRGKPVLMIPSLGRGSSDFDDLADRLARHGFMTILPEPMGIGRSKGPPPKDLFDLAADTSDVIAALCEGPVDVLGHAFGNRVARATATAYPAQVRRLVLLAGGGEVKLSSEMLAALKGSTLQGTKPDSERLKDLQAAFFAPGNDAGAWLTGWHPAVAAVQSQVARATPSASWWKGGRADILLVQAAEDPIAPPQNAVSLKSDIGDRVIVVTLPDASHAILPEQPEAVARAIASYLDAQKPDAAKIQSAIDRSVRR